MGSNDFAGLGFEFLFCRSVDSDSESNDFSEPNDCNTLSKSSSEDVSSFVKGLNCEGFYVTLCSSKTFLRMSQIGDGDHNRLGWLG